MNIKDLKAMREWKIDSTGNRNGKENKTLQRPCQ